jgi:hypothetical protein
MIIKSGVVRHFCLISIAAVLMAGGASARANDGGIAYGGTPGLLSGHPTVSMTSEKILLVVGEKEVRVECNFVFTNGGKACTVRMGFPDEGYGASDPDEENTADNLLKTPARTTFTSFKSYINGKPVSTKLIRADKAGKYWHAKTVQFAAHQILNVRDVYTQQIGGGIVNVGDKVGSAQEVGYVLHTGASWHGNIGRSEITVRFNTSNQTDPIIPLHLTDVGTKRSGEDLSPTNVQKAPKGIIVWSGPSAPAVVGKSLTFVRTNWKPSKKDDIDLYYGYRY